ncbi:hypothetical protein QVD17_03381 [Tagetes erecta]|uniref:BRCT domain-containing protein n=1 Tax=Tagetes erecta TaxID=13708 RepID=A0AAD8L9U9_TARER|nr:hypothetical protein QVD17_03381 [Tagetes erecta]
MRKTTFKGANVFMSRNLVPPELFASLHDVLKDNGADIFLCCDPSRNGPTDYHIISSRDHEKFDDLRQKGCNLLGPQCVFSCAKEHRVLPKQGFTCCLAMDGVKILASGFETNEKDEIGKLVTAMGGLLQTKASSDVSFVIVKNVLAAKYKWALNNLKKPIVSESWLHQCWKEHRVVSHEAYRALPFSGLTISVTQVPLDERKEIEKLVVQNGGKYSAELTKKSTHLHAPEGDKYKVAKRWGHIHIVNRTWFNQSVARRACLNEESYPVQKSPATSMNSQRTSSKVVRNSDSALHQEISCDGMVDADLETTLSQNMASTISDIPVLVSDENTPPCVQQKTFFNIDACVAEDSQSEDNDLYLLNCKIHLVGFDASEMRRLVNMVRRGGGSRYMSLNEQLTHIVVGSPSERSKAFLCQSVMSYFDKLVYINVQVTGDIIDMLIDAVWLCLISFCFMPLIIYSNNKEVSCEKKEVRSLSAMGVINVVKTVWLEDCEREKKEVIVQRIHAAYDLLLPKDSISFNKGSISGMPGLKQGNPSTIQPTLSNILSQSSKDQQKTQNVISNKSQDKKSSVFIGRSFCFSSSFPDVQRGEIIDWIHEGGGEVVDSRTEKYVNYTVESHGVLCTAQFTGGTNVSPHWIRSCLQDGHLLDVSSHVLFSPLQCKVPLPEFIGLKLCVSQYEDKEKELLRNLCHVLGGRLVNRLTKKNKVVALSQFLPKEATASDREAGMCTMTQNPTQAAQMISSNGESQLTSQSHKPITNDVRIDDSSTVRNEVKYSAVCSKKARLSEDGSKKGPLSSGSVVTDPFSIKGSLSSGSVPTEPFSLKGPLSSGSVSTDPFSIKGPLSSASVSTDPEHVVTERGGEAFKSVPDVASAIEDLLEQTSKIHDQMSPKRTATDKTVSEVFTSDCSRLGHDLHDEDPHSAFGLSKHWTRRSSENDDITKPGREENTGIYGGFSETQTESQVVSYAEDLSGRQMIIDRVRTRSGLTPNPSSP